MQRGKLTRPWVTSWRTRSEKAISKKENEKLKAMLKDGEALLKDREAMLEGKNEKGGGLLRKERSRGRSRSTKSSRSRRNSRSTRSSSSGESDDQKAHKEGEEKDGEEDKMQEGEDDGIVRLEDDPEDRLTIPGATDEEHGNDDDNKEDSMNEKHMKIGTNEGKNEEVTTQNEG